MEKTTNNTHSLTKANNWQTKPAIIVPNKRQKCEEKKIAAATPRNGRFMFWCSANAAPSTAYCHFFLLDFIYIHLLNGKFIRINNYLLWANVWPLSLSFPPTVEQYSPNHSQFYIQSIKVKMLNDFNTYLFPHCRPKVEITSRVFDGNYCSYKWKCWFGMAVTMFSHEIGHFRYVLCLIWDVNHLSWAQTFEQQCISFGHRKKTITRKWNMNDSNNSNTDRKMNVTILVFNWVERPHSRLPLSLPLKHKQH